jgi:hypothetical protein
MDSDFFRDLLNNRYFLGGIVLGIALAFGAILLFTRRKK